MSTSVVEVNTPDSQASNSDSLECTWEMWENILYCAVNTAEKSQNKSDLSVNSSEKTANTSNFPKACAEDSTASNSASSENNWDFPRQTRVKWANSPENSENISERTASNSEKRGNIEETMASNSEKWASNSGKWESN